MLTNVLNLIQNGHFPIFSLFMRHFFVTIATVKVDLYKVYMGCVGTLIVSYIRRLGPFGVQSAVIECLTRDLRAAGSSLAVVTALCP